jgi:hypothetical protein
MERAVIGRAHRSLALTALCVRGSVLGDEWWVFIIGVNGPPVMEKSVPVVVAAAQGRGLHKWWNRFKGWKQ